jgi:hypothetical protein
LAEKELSALKEKLAAHNDGNSKTEGLLLSQNAQSAEQNQEANNPRRTPNSNHEQELQAKDREVGINSGFGLILVPFASSAINIRDFIMPADGM